jgi:hypothetical protein
VFAIFDEQVQEGRVYRISGVSVKFNFGSVVASFHRYKFVFTERTVVDPSPNCYLPTHGLSLIGTEDVHNKKNTFRHLVGKFKSYIF